MDTADALRAQRAHAAQRTSQIPPTGRPGSPRPVLAIEPLSRRSAGRRGIRSGAAGTRSLRPSFSTPSWPPGAPSRRLGSGRARLGLCPDREPGAGSPALRPLRTGPPAGSPRCGPHAVRAHTMPARGPLRSARWRFHTERGSIFFPLLGKRRLGRRAASGWQPAQGQVPSRLQSSGTSGEDRGVAGRRGGRGSAAGGWVCAPASDEGGDQSGDEAQGGSAPGRDPSVPSPALLPHPGGARRVRGGAARTPALRLLAFLPPLPTIGRL